MADDPARGYSLITIFKIVSNGVIGRMIAKALYEVDPENPSRCVLSHREQALFSGCYGDTLVSCQFVAVGPLLALCKLAADVRHTYTIGTGHAMHVCLIVRKEYRAEPYSETNRGSL